LKGVQAAGPIGIDAVHWRKNNEVKEFYARPGRIGQKGRMYKDMYLVQVKSLPNRKSAGTISRS
jgi:branched-chain amino acid transport system substrate-binding protein